MIAGFSVLSLALDAQTDIVTTQRIISDIEIKKQQEQFAVFASIDENNILSMNVKNQGQNPVEISSIWIVNKTLSNQPVTRFDVNYDDAFVPSGFTNDNVFDQSLYMIPDTYDIKIISSLCFYLTYLQLNQYFVKVVLLYFVCYLDKFFHL